LYLEEITCNVNNLAMMITNMAMKQSRTILLRDWLNAGTMFEIY
jgi:hypothetical protein